VKPSNRIIENVLKGKSPQDALIEAINSTILKKLASALNYGRDPKSIDRLCNMIAYGPLQSKPIDKKLLDAGWLVVYDDKDTGAYEFNQEYKKVLFDKSGSFNQRLMSDLENNVSNFGSY